MIAKILKTLNENDISYYNGGEDTGIQVLVMDMEKAEELTNNLYRALKKTLYYSVIYCLSFIANDATILPNSLQWANPSSVGLPVKATP